MRKVPYFDKILIIMSSFEQVNKGLHTNNLIITYSFAGRVVKL